MLSQCHHLVSLDVATASEMYLFAGRHGNLTSIFQECKDEQSDTVRPKNNIFQSVAHKTQGAGNIAYMSLLNI